MGKTKIKGTELISGVKRVNISLPLTVFENVCYCAEYAGVSPTTICQSWVTMMARSESENLVKSKKYVPRAVRGNDLFDGEQTLKIKPRDNKKCLKKRKK